MLLEPNSASLLGFNNVKAFEIAVLALCFYDYLLTLPLEVEVMWSRKFRFRISTLLYFITRYFPAVNVVYAIVYAPLKSCTAVSLFVIALPIVSRAGITATLIARTYAGCGQRRVILGVLSVLGLTVVVLDCFQISCKATFRWLLANSVARVVFDATVIILTVFRAARTFNLTYRVGVDEGTSLTWYLLKNGIMYFFTAFILEVSAIAIIHPEANLDGAIGFYPVPIVGILISRFLLDLRRIHQHPNGTSHDSHILTSIRGISQHIQFAFMDDFLDPTSSARAQEDTSFTNGSSDFPMDYLESSAEVESDHIPNAVEMVYTSPRHLKATGNGINMSA